jgi:hypothetical protein
MNGSLCKYEQEVMTALRFGPLSHELHAHVTGCTECSEVMFVAHFLQGDADSMSGISIPNADLVWRRALRRSRAEAAAHAIRPIQWAARASIAVIISAALWLSLGSPAWLGSLPALLSISSLQAVRGMWVVVSLASGAVTIMTAVFGAVYMLRVDRFPVALAKN